MYRIVLGIMVLVTVYLGVRLFLKLREISSARGGNADEEDAAPSSEKRKLLDLQIEHPPSLETPDSEKNPKQESTR